MDTKENSNKESDKNINIEQPSATVVKTKRIRREPTAEQLRNPFHGVKLVQVLERLVEFYGWQYLAKRVNIRCFIYKPTMKSSLGFLRKTTWAREFVEDIYLEMLDDEKYQKDLVKKD